MTMHETRLLDADGHRRFRSVAAATFASGLVITLFFAVTTHLIAPEHGWVSAFALGGMVALWSAIMAGATIGNGLHEHRAERRDR
jgi:hypothetical protein